MGIGSQETSRSKEALPPPLSGLAGWFGLPTFLEARAQLEWARLRSDPVWRRAPMPGADSWPVLLVPGFLGTERSVSPLRSWLGRLGFAAEVAPVGLNAWASHYGAGVVSDSLRRMADTSGRPVLVLGHSRGGQHGTVAAVRAPQEVGALITLGSPLRTALPVHFLTRIPVTALATVGGWFASAEQRQAEHDYGRDLVGPFPSQVPRISIWSKSDGIVDWRASLVADGRNVEVSSSHIGMVVNAGVYRALADVLASLVESPSARAADAAATLP